MAEHHLEVEGSRALVRTTSSLGLVEPVNPSSRGVGRHRRPDAPELELAVRAKEWAMDTAKAQGFPPCVEDMSVIGEVAILLASGRAPVRSGPPDRLHAVGIEAISAPDGRVDDDPGEHGTDDRSLSSRVEIRPLRPQRPRVTDEPVERRGA